jgi:hypothetical protein
LFLSVAYSQSGIKSFFKTQRHLKYPRRNAVVISEVSLATLTLLGLNQLWYSDYTKSSFKTVNDSREWRQMDKFGHVFSSYQLGRLGANALNWAGVGRKDQLIYGSTLGLGFLTAVEIMDGIFGRMGFFLGQIWQQMQWGQVCMSVKSYCGKTSACY